MQERMPVQEPVAVQERMPVQEPMGVQARESRRLRQLPRLVRGRNVQRRKAVRRATHEHTAASAPPPVRRWQPHFLFLLPMSPIRACLQ